MNLICVHRDLVNYGLFIYSVCSRMGFCIANQRVLHIDVKTITFVWIKNPIEDGDAFDAKTSILDVKVMVNGAMIVDIEMQVLREKQWTDSLWDIFAGHLIT